MIKKWFNYTKTHEWAMLVSFVLAVSATIESNIELLPSGVGAVILGPVILIQGGLIRMRVWSEASQQQV